MSKLLRRSVLPAMLLAALLLPVGAGASGKVDQTNVTRGGLAGVTVTRASGKADQTNVTRGGLAGVAEIRASGKGVQTKAEEKTPVKEVQEKTTPAEKVPAPKKVKKSSGEGRLSTENCGQLGKDRGGGV